jgi:hypothetical protein
MQQTTPSTAAAHGHDKVRFRRTMLVLAVSAGLALSTAACSGAPSNPAPAASGSPGNVTAGGESGEGPGQQASGTFSLAFAKCMRAHGVPDFPDPDGQAGQLGPGSGIDPSSPQFQAALNGPCESLAPAAWVSSGKVTR